MKNVSPGLPVFLFNYDDKKLHGIFEAASSGQMLINPYAWNKDGDERTPFPAQVSYHCFFLALSAYVDACLVGKRYERLLK